MINVASLKIGDKTCLGANVGIPDSPPLIIITADKGFVMCGFLNVEVAEKLNVCAAVVSGVKTFEDVLNGQVKAVTSKAKGLGVEIGMKGSEALARMF